MVCEEYAKLAWIVDPFHIKGHKVSMNFFILAEERQNTVYVHHIDRNRNVIYPTQTVSIILIYQNINI